MTAREGNKETVKVQLQRHRLQLHLRLVDVFDRQVHRRWHAWMHLFDAHIHASPMRQMLIAASADVLVLVLVLVIVADDYVAQAAAV